MKKDLDLFKKIGETETVTEVKQSVGNASIVDDPNDEAFAVDEPYVPTGAGAKPQNSFTGNANTEGKASWNELLNVIKNVDSGVVSVDAAKANLKNSLINTISSLKKPSTFTADAELQEWFRMVGYDKKLISALETCLSKLQK